MEAIGLHLEGQTLKLAHVKNEKGSLRILALESVILPEPMYQVAASVSNEVNANGNGYDDPFGLSQKFADNEDDQRVDRESKTNIDVLIELLNKYPIKKVPVGITVAEDSVHFNIFRNSERLTGKKLKERLADEVSVFNVSLKESSEDEARFIQVDDSTFLIQNNVGEIPLLSLLVSAKPFINKKMAIGLIIASEIGLGHLFRLHHELNPVDSSVLIYIGYNFSKIIFLENGIIKSVSPMINMEGHEDELLETLYAKLFFMLDQINAQIPEEIVVAGESGIDRALTYFRELFPDIPCSSLPEVSNIDASYLETASRSKTASFAVALGVSAGMLLKPTKEYANTNLLPKSLKKDQSTFRLAWHGYLLLSVLFLSTLYYTFTWNHYQNRKEKAEFSVTLVDEALVSEKSIAAQIENLAAETQKYKGFIALTDSLWYPGPLYSRTLYALSGKVSDIKSTWITRFSMNDDTFQMLGSTIYRSRISSLANLTGTAEIKYMEEEPVRNNKIFTFELLGNPQSFAEMNGGPSVINLGSPENILKLAFNGKK